MSKDIKNQICIAKVMKKNTIILFQSLDYMFITNWLSGKSIIILSVISFMYFRFFIYCS